MSFRVSGVRDLFETQKKKEEEEKEKEKQQDTIIIPKATVEPSAPTPAPVPENNNTIVVPKAQVQNESDILADSQKLDAVSPSNLTMPDKTKMDIVHPEEEQKQVQNGIMINNLLDTDKTEERFTHNYDILTQGSKYAALSAPQAAGGLINMGGKLMTELYEAVPEIRPDVDFQIDEVTSKYGTDMIRNNRNYVESLNLLPDPDNAWDNFIFELGSGATSVGTSIGFGFLTGGSAGAAMLFGVYQAGNLFTEFDEVGVDTLPAAAGAIAGGFIEGYLEKLGLDFLLTKFGSPLMSSAIHAVSEGLQEFSQELGANVVSAMVYDKDRNLFENTWRSAMLGAILGAGSNHIMGTLGVSQDNEVIKGVIEKARLAVVKEIEGINQKLVNGEYREVIDQYINNEKGFLRVGKGEGFTPKEIEVLGRLGVGQVVDLENENIDLKKIKGVLNKNKQDIIKERVRVLKTQMESESTTDVLWGAKVDGESNFPLWYREYVRSYGNKPGTADLTRIAIQQLKAGYREDGGKVAEDTEYTFVENTLAQIREKERRGKKEETGGLFDKQNTTYKEEATEEIEESIKDKTEQSQIPDKQQTQKPVQQELKTDETNLEWKEQQGTSFEGNDSGETEMDIAGEVVSEEQFIEDTIALEEEQNTITLEDQQYADEQLKDYSPIPEGEVQKMFAENIGDTVTTRKWSEIVSHARNTVRESLNDIIHEYKGDDIPWEDNILDEIITGKTGLIIPKGTHAEWVEGINQTNPGVHMHMFDSRNAKLPVDEVLEKVKQVFGDIDTESKLIEALKQRTMERKVHQESQQTNKDMLEQIRMEEPVFSTLEELDSQFSDLMGKIEGGLVKMDSPTNTRAAAKEINQLIKKNNKLQNALNRKITKLKERLDKTKQTTQKVRLNKNEKIQSKHEETVYLKKQLRKTQSDKKKTEKEISKLEKQRSETEQKAHRQEIERDAWITQYNWQNKKALKTATREGTGIANQSEIITYENQILKYALSGQERAAKAAFIEGKKKGIFDANERFEERMDKIRDRREFADIVGKMRVMEKSLDSKGFDPEWKATIKSVLKGLDLKKTSKRREAQRQSSRKYLQKVMADPTKNVYVTADTMEWIFKNSVYDLSLDQLKTIYGTVKNMHKQAMLKEKMLKSLEKRQYAKKQAQLSEILTEMKENMTEFGKKVDKSDVKEADNHHTHSKKWYIDAWQDYMLNNYRMERIFEKLDGMEEDGIFKRTFYDTINKAYDKELVSFFEKMEDFYEFIYEFDIDIPSFVSKQETIHSGDFTKVKLTRSQKVGVYLANKDQGARKHLMETYTEEEVKAIVRSVEKNAQELGLADYLTRHWKRQGEEIVPIFRMLNGEHFETVANYYPIIIERGDLTFDDAIKFNYFDPTARNTYIDKHFTEERVGSGHPLNIDAIESFLRNLQVVEHYKAFALPVADMNKVLYDDGFKKTMFQKMGQKTYDVIKNWYDDAVDARLNRSLTKADKVMFWLRKNSTFAMLGLNIISGMRQTISMFNAIAYFGLPSMLHGMQKTAMNYHDVKAEAFSKIPQLKFRRGQIERTLREVEEASHTKEILTGRKGFQKKAMWHIQMFDEMTVLSIYAGAYDNAIAQGKTEKEALNYVERGLRKTQPQAAKKDLAGWHRMGGVAALFTQFTNQINNNWNFINHDIVGMRKTGKIGNMEVAHRILFSWFLPSLIMGMLSRGRLPRDVKEMGMDFAGYYFGGLYFAGSMVNNAMQGYGGITPPAFTFVEDYVKAAQYKTWQAKARNVASGTAKMVGVPWNQPKRTTEGVIDWLEGETKDFRRLIWSKYNLEATEATSDEGESVPHGKLLQNQDQISPKINLPSRYTNQGGGGINLPSRYTKK